MNRFPEIETLDSYLDRNNIPREDKATGKLLTLIDRVDMLAKLQYAKGTAHGLSRAQQLLKDQAWIVLASVGIREVR